MSVNDLTREELPVIQEIHLVPTGSGDQFTNWPSSQSANQLFDLLEAETKGSVQYTESDTRDMRQMLNYSYLNQDSTASYGIPHDESCVYSFHESPADKGVPKSWAEGPAVYFDEGRYPDSGPEYQLRFPRDPPPPLWHNIDLSNVLTDTNLSVLSDDDCSDIIVEESDEESEISISDVVDSAPGAVGVLSCIVCGILSKDTSLTHYVHITDNFPLTFTSQTPISRKLKEFLPYNAEVKFTEMEICRRCLSLVETVESLELRLSEMKKTLCDFLSRFASFVPHEDYQSKEKDHVESLVEPQVQPVKPSGEKAEPAKSCNFICDLCGKDYSRKSSLERHIESHSAGFLCEMCGKIYSQKGNLVNHLRKHLGLFRFKCPHCDERFMRKFSYRKHLRTHSQLRQHECSCCKDRFETEGQLHDHIADCSKFCCSKCEKYFRSQTDLMSHTCKVLECSVCQKRFKHQSDLTHHLASHSEDRRFRCSDCPRSYKTKSALNFHMKRNHSTNTSQCSKCSAQFASPTDLQNHLSVDHSIRSYDCKECGKTFSERRYLRAHLKLHLGERKTVICPVCNVKLHSNLKAHMTVHAKEKAFQCNICQIKFTFRTSLNKHNRRKHSNTCVNNQTV